MTQRFVVDAGRISDWQTCRRRYLLNADWRVLRWRPKSLFDACLRRGVLALSQGGEVDKTVADASSAFLESAANPGLDIPYGSNPFVIAKDWTAMLSTILPSLLRRGLPTLAAAAAVPLNGSVEWHTRAARGTDGMLHRWLTVDRWEPSDLSRELHSWWTLGDVAATRLPMVLHVIEIGQQRNGRRQSAWARAWKHPSMPSLRLRFRRTDGSEFRGYLPFYLSDQARVSAEAWVEQMWQERAAEPLMHDAIAEVPDAATCDIILRDILAETIAMRAALTDRVSSPFSVWPMSRGACDGGRVPCPWQAVCYASQVTDPSSLGLYQRRQVD